MALRSGIVATQGMSCLDEKDHTDGFDVTTCERGFARQRQKMMYDNINYRCGDIHVKCVADEFGLTTGIHELVVDENSFEESYDFDMKNKMLSSKVDSSGPEMSEDPESMGVKPLVHAAPGTVDGIGNSMHKSITAKTLGEKQPEPHLLKTRTDSSVPLGKWVTLRKLLLILCFANKFSPGASYVYTNQTLPQMCWDRLKFLDMCPNSEMTRAYELAEWSKACCSAFTNTTFHCQHIEIGMQDKVFPACLEEQVCNAGFLCILQVGDDGFPKLVQKACESGFFQPVSRLTSLIVNPTCSRSHTWCDPEKAQAVFCRGDATSDTRCICADGYSLINRGPACRSASFTVDDVCECALNTSTDKRSCTKWPNLFCSQLSQEQLMNITCTAPSTPAASTTTPVDTTATGTESNSRVLQIAGCIGGIFVLAVLVFLILVSRKKLKSCIYRCLKQKSEDYFSVHQGDNAESSVAQTDTLARGDRGVPQAPWRPGGLAAQGSIYRGDRAVHIRVFEEEEEESSV